MNIFYANIVVLRRKTPDICSLWTYHRST